ncbi:cytochrome P450 [Nocardia mangyaensis]|uniref:cytochrome P450 n=1 Tax=Nocardia mangyaensis TaxID=2213200 RepID=UPI002675721B|nr:cytochrome P450 [Nocardia mangyaensis]MDO3648392.1 cytochrome P450 [Nocardia mangyaensis]
MTTTVASQHDAESILAELFAPETRPDPYPVLRALRTESPLIAKGGDLVIVANYADCQQVLRDPTVRNDPKLSRLGKDHPERPESLLFLDPPAHTRIRRLVSKAFTPRVIRASQPQIHSIVDDLVAGIASKSEFDVIADFALPLPVRIMCALLGIPLEEFDDFEPAARRLGRVLDFNLVVHNDDLDDAEGARNELMNYLKNLITRRRGDLGEDLLSRLIQVEEEGEVLSEGELLATCVLLMVAGHETTANLIANGVHALLRHPEQHARLAADPELGISATDEALRYDAPIQFVMRIATREMQVSGTTVTPGTAMLVLLAAANRDPAHYPDADRFDVTRGAADHLAFSAGAHFCLAAALGRAEGAAALSAFAGRVIDPVLVPDSVRYRPNVNLRGIQTMSVTHGGVRLR